MRYAIFNSERSVLFEHPRYGVWSTEDYSEAQEMLAAIRDYMRSVGLRSRVQYLQIVDEETREVIPEAST